MTNYGVPYIEPEVLYWVENGEVDRAISLREPSSPMNRAALFGVSLPYGWVPTIAQVLSGCFLLYLVIFAHGAVA